MTVVARLRAAGCVFAEDEARLLTAEARTPAELDTMVRRRVDGEPLEVILGWAGFHGLRITVEPGVFVPRQRSELLVRHALTLTGPGAVVLDLCCGTGALGAAIATELPGIRLYAADIEPAAVRCARVNVADAGGEVFEGDLFEPLPQSLRGRVDLLVVNAPYVPTDAIAMMPPEARDHEPRVALDGGHDGVEVHRRVAAEAPQWLAPGGHLLIETGETQSSNTAEAMAHNGLTPEVITDDDLYATIVVGARR
ncbi:putative protein N(5)-glutamine methyltransferase [Amycolatopsis azurea]|uniref:peptide chain release factor N(5)-glutamine methyltransferase n=1 Tax=Amycolatopsis azurea DSM 43854 TaxID=1238180 RepID=M2P309_9PSEU|nr:putative protein N(5)-glutamine methyltransferase [Amycolatopsis azurea]EMD29539.1 Methylase [Amycolatopsis azurea DSM 43854]OOC02688.1 methylase [Amycolatopsis azurea DSM 43854]